MKEKYQLSQTKLKEFIPTRSMLIEMLKVIHQAEKKWSELVT